MIGPDKDNFMKGRRCENQGLGIGAFAYYRRIVENHKDRIFDELIRACKKIPDAADVVTELERAKAETRFTKAVDSMKHGLPQALLIGGSHNPLTLLHSALSEAIHEHSDEDCLEIAQSIRIVLTEMSERVSSVLKESAELNSAVTRLLKRAPVQKKDKNSRDLGQETDTES